ncbi:hypothetical protein [Sinomicrobium sp. M5D2P9]
MNTNPKKLLHHLKEDVTDHIPALRPHPEFKDKLQLPYFYMDSFTDYIESVGALIGLCDTLLDSGEERCKLQIHKVLMLIGKLLCVGEDAP